MRKIKKIYIHHSALPKDLGIDVIRKLHLERGFDDVGYHFVIEENGKIRNGRKVEIQGAHVKGDNIDSIGICVCGNFEVNQPSECQIRALKSLICKLYKKFGKLKILGHKDYPASDTLCPGHYLYKLLPALIPVSNELKKSKNSLPKVDKKIIKGDL